MKPLQLRQVNAALKREGAAEVLVRGNGYYYFAEGDAHEWPATAIYVNRISQLNLDQWIWEWRLKRGEWLKNKGEA